MDELLNISPIDGRYNNLTKDLSEYFSEYALIKYRVYIEIKWLEYLCSSAPFDYLNLDSSDIDKLLNIYNSFDLNFAKRVKEIESVTKHDVKAVEYYIREEIKKANLDKLSSLIHFSCTSEDINNLAYSIMISKSVNLVWRPELEKMLDSLKAIAKDTRDVAMCGHTHGQVASPTTFGKELAVFIYRIEHLLKYLDNIKLTGKFSGAVGNFNAHIVACPEIDWFNFAKEFVESLDLEFNPLTTQIEPHDTLCMMLNLIKSINSVVNDFDSDMWLYISMGYVSQKNLKGEVGSSVMPHKINPINFENSMANMRLSNSLIDTLGDNLPISRMQRDLSDSSTLRNIGNVLAYSIIAIKQTEVGLSKTNVNASAMLEDLHNNPEILSEAIQTVLRKNGIENAYEILKDLTRGNSVSMEDIHNFISSLDINEADKQSLLAITPENYIGIASKLVDLI